ASQAIMRQPAPAPAVNVAPKMPMAALQPPIATPAPVVESAYRPMPKPAPETDKPKTIDPNVLRCLETLRDASDPEVRHAAVQMLVSYNWREHPEAISGLMYAARHDKH